MDYLPGIILSSYQPKRFGVSFGEPALDVVSDYLALQLPEISAFECKNALFDLRKEPFGEMIEALQMSGLSCSLPVSELAIFLIDLTSVGYTQPAETLNMRQVSVSAIEIELALFIIEIDLPDYSPLMEQLEMQMIAHSGFEVTFGLINLTAPEFHQSADLIELLLLQISQITIEAA